MVQMQRASCDAADIELLLGRPVAKEVFGPLRLTLGLVTSLVLWFRVRSHDAVVVGGTLVFLVTMYAGFRGTAACLAALGPILCWKVDRWMSVAPDRDGRDPWDAPVSAAAHRG